MKGKLFLIPNVLDGGLPGQVLSETTLLTVRQLRYFIYEEERAARAFLARAGLREILEQLKWGVLNEHTDENDLFTLINPLLNGLDAGLLSEAGCPAVADPGSNLVRYAHELQIKVVPLTGPSSIMLALMASGLNGQRFCFHGYLPIKSPQRTKALKELEGRSRQFNETQIFIETPYRNRQILDEMIRSLSHDTLLCIAADLTAKTEFIQTKTIREWKAGLPEIHKRPAVFLIGIA